MPKGFIITKWSDEGLKILYNHPNELNLDYDDLMRIFYAHITGAGESGTLVVRLEKSKSNVSSYFTGMEANSDDEEPYMINLILNIDEEPDYFGESTIKRFNTKILEYLRKMDDDGANKLKIKEDLGRYLKNALFILDRLLNMTKEQRLAQIFTNNKKMEIHNLLREKALSKEELQTALEEKLNRIIVNLEVSLDSFYKTDLVKQDWIQGLPSIYLFLLMDFTINRKPPKTIVERAKKNRPNPSIAKLYLNEVKEFYTKYTPSDEDNKVIAQAMVNPDVYDFIILFREKAYPLKKLPKSSRDAFIDTKAILKSMEDDKIIKIIKDIDGTQWVFLLSDISVETFYPSYLMEEIRKKYTAKTLKKEIAIKHLNLLEKSYVK